jgi:hypothetical protein
LPVDHHGDHKIGPIVVILGMNIVKYEDMPYGKNWLKSEIQNGCQEAFFGSFHTVKMTHLPLHHHGD